MRNWFACSETIAFQYVFGGFISEKESFKAAEPETKPSSADEQLFSLKSCWIIFFFSILLAAQYYLLWCCMGLFVLTRWTDLWGLSKVNLFKLSISRRFVLQAELGVSAVQVCLCWGGDTLGRWQGGRRACVLALKGVCALGLKALKYRLSRGF